MAIATRNLVLGGAGLVGFSTAATSAVSLYALARECGIPEYLAAALPVALDAGAGVAALVWITEKGEARSWGRAIAIGALLATLAGNGVEHAISSNLLPVTLVLVLIVGACIPAMLWATAHLAALLMSQPAEKPTAVRAPKAQPRRDVSPPSPVVAAPKPVEAPVVVETPAKVALHLAPAPVPADSDRAAELIASGVGRKTLAVELGISEHAARELLQRARVQA